MEDGKPLLIFPDEIERNKTISVYTKNGEHGVATRAYLRSLPKPASDAEKLVCWLALERYANHAAYIMAL
jgi:hypothetical protein